MGCITVTIGLPDRDQLFAYPYIGTRMCPGSRLKRTFALLKATLDWSPGSLLNPRHKANRTFLPELDFGKTHGLCRILKDYFKYYQRCRTHLSLEKDAPISRPVEPPSLGHVIEIPKVGGLHHLYTRKAA